MSREHDFLTRVVLPAARIATREIAAALAPLGLAPAQFAMLDLLGREGEYAPCSDRPSSGHRNLNHHRIPSAELERDGWIERKD